MDVIIFAAGHGNRLRPLTDSLPKPLIEVAGLCLIEIHLYRLAAAGFERVIINLHHLGEMIAERLGGGEKYGLEIVYSREAHQALETAGGIVNALGLIKSEFFAAISADVLCDYPLERLCPAAESTALGHLILVDNPPHHHEGDFSLDEHGCLKKRGAVKDASGYTYSGLAWFRRALFEPLSPGKRALRPVLDAAIDKQQLTGEHHAGLWSDIGTKARLDQARAAVSIGEYIASIKQSIS